MKIFCGLTFLFAVGTAINPLQASLGAVGLQDVTVVDELPDALNIMRQYADNAMEEGSWYVMDLSNIVQKYRNWTHYLPRVVPFYAVKCNNNPFLVKTLAALGAGFDCASKNEMKEVQVLDFGVDPSHIIFAQTNKYEHHLNYSKANNIKKMTFDGELELHKIKKFYPDADLLLRFRVDAKKAIVTLGTKFGCEVDIDCRDLIHAASQLGLNLVGVSFHVGTGTRDFEVYAEGIRLARKLFDDAAELGVTLKILDIGGGFLGATNTSLDEVSKIINNALDKFFPYNNITIMSEPGRYFAASSVSLACRIHSKRAVVDNGKIKKMMYILNDGLYGSFSKIEIENRKMDPISIGINTDREEYNSSFWGPTCDSHDKIADNLLMHSMNTNEMVMFKDMGAYAVGIQTDFNGMPRPTYQSFISKSDIAELDPSKIKEKFNF